MTTIVNGVATDTATIDQSPWETATFTKADVTAAGSSGAWTTANSPITIATITGRVKIRAYGIVTTNFTSTGSTGTLAVGVANATTLLINTITANGTLLQEGFIVGTTSAAIMNLLQSSGLFLTSNAGDVILTIGANNMTAGGMTIYIEWIPLSEGATVVAATP